jgi:hypothetical protein
MPANLITLAHFSVSSAMSLPKLAGESTSGGAPRSASRAFILNVLSGGTAAFRVVQAQGRSRAAACDIDPSCREGARHEEEAEYADEATSG